MPTYNVLTWDPEAEEYTEQAGLSVPSISVPLRGMLAALRELKQIGYPCNRDRRDSDPSVLVERNGP